MLTCMSLFDFLPFMRCGSGIDVRFMRWKWRHVYDVLLAFFLGGCYWFFHRFGCWGVRVLKLERGIRCVRVEERLVWVVSY